MKFNLLEKNQHADITELFIRVFSNSEGESEGALLGQLVSQLASGIDNDEILCLGACAEQRLIGCIFFTRLRFERPIQVYMLAPVAVSTEDQGKGVGQALIQHGLDILKKRAVNLTISYGDPAYYSKVGFEALSEQVIQAPLKLSMPMGWLGQSLTADPIPTLDDRPVCVEAFNDPVYW